MCSWSQEAELTFAVAEICSAADNTSWAVGLSPPMHTHPKSHHEGWRWHEWGPLKNTQLWAGWSQCQIKWQGEDLGDGSSGRGTCWASLVLWAHVKVERERLMPGSRPLASASALPSTSAHAHTPTVCSFKYVYLFYFLKKHPLQGKHSKRPTHRLKISSGPYCNVCRRKPFMLKSSREDPVEQTITSLSLTPIYSRQSSRNPNIATTYPVPNKVQRQIFSHLSKNKILNAQCKANPYFHGMLVS